MSENRELCHSCDTYGSPESMFRLRIQGKRCDCGKHENPESRLTLHESYFHESCAAEEFSLMASTF